MKIGVLLFAMWRERAREPQIELEVSEGSSAREAAEAVASRFGAGPWLGALSFAVNGSFCAGEERLNEGDLVALIPPVSGG